LGDCEVKWYAHVTGRRMPL
jgi:hypothetical protein